MNIVIYSGHPAQYHFYKNAARKMMSDGHRVKMLIKTKDILEDLLKEDGWEYENIQPKMRSNNTFSILWAAFRRTARVISISRRFKADILVGGDSSIAWAGWLLKKPSVTTTEDDIEVVSSFGRITYPFSSTILVPDVCSVGKFAGKKIPYYGFMKLAYLHPSYFTPDRNILEKYGISGKYILLRLVKLTAYHDTDIHGLSAELVDRIISVALSNGYKVYVNAEGKINPNLEKYRLNIKYTDIHHIMSFASLLVSDSQSMSVEAAMLGVPSVRYSSFSGKISVLEELEHKYNLTYGVNSSEPEKLISLITKILLEENLPELYRQRRQAMLSDKIDVSAFLTWFIENYPFSRAAMKENPSYCYKFK